MRNTPRRTVSQAVAIYLTRFHNGHTLAFLCKMFGPDLEWQKVRNWCDEIELAFMRDIFPIHLGPSSITRETLIQKHTTPIAKALLETGNNNLILVFDGTYSYHQKSGINAFQRQSCNLQKGRPLAKPFIGCTTTGYIIQVWGSYTANASDGSILPHILREDGEFRRLVKSGDHFILDRRFRNCAPDLEEKGIVVQMPTCHNGKLSTKEANLTRFCTKLRWVIESISGVLKSKFKLLDRVTPNQSLCKIDTEYKIAASLHNMFGTVLSSDHDDMEQIVSEMKRKVQMSNSLEDYVNSNNLNLKRGVFVRIEDASNIGFPQLSMDQLKLLTLGTYQLKQANGYLIEHFSVGGRYFELQRNNL